MAKQYFVRLVIRNQRDDLVFEVREAESDRLAARRAEHDEREELDFCWFQSVEGKSVIVNLADIQAARFFWEAADGPSDLVRHEGPIEIQLRGRKKPLEEFAEHPGQILDLFVYLDLEASEPVFYSILDADGDPLVLNTREVVWIIAPQPVLDEGWEYIKKEGGMADET